MDLSVSKQSEVSLREQVFSQLVLLIGTRQLKPGDALPSVRALARRLGIHHNTVSQAYQDLASKGFLTGRRGSRLVVRSPDEPLNLSQRKDLDDLINDTVKLARQQGFTLQQLRKRVRERLLEAPPDHFLVVSDEATMRELLRIELTELLDYPVDTCSTEDLCANPGIALGSLVLTPPGLMPKALPLLPKSHPAIPILYSEAKEQLQLVRQSQKAALVAVVSISQFYLDMARGVLSPLIGKRHSLAEYLITGGKPFALGSADIVICDCAAHRRLQAQLKRKTVIAYRLVSHQCVEQIKSIMADAAAELS